MKTDRAALKLLVNAVRPDQRRFTWAVVTLVIAGLFEAMGPLLGKVFVDDYLMAQTSTPSDAAWLLLGMLLVNWAASGLRYLSMITMARVAMQAVQRLRQWVHAHVLKLPIATFDSSHSGQLVSRITNDTEQIRRLYVQALFEMLQGLTILFGAIVAMAWLDWRLMLIVLMLVPIMTGIIWLYRRLSAAAVMRTRELRSDINAQIAESIAGMTVLQASRSTGRAASRFANTNQHYYASRLREMRANAWLLRPALDFVSLLLVIATVAAFGTLPFEALQVGLLYAFISYIERVVEPLIQITQQFSMLQQSLASATRLDELLRTPTEKHSETSRQLSSGRVQIKNLSFGYQADNPVLNQIDLDIPAGHYFGIVGHTGAGKSSLLALLLRFYHAQEGQILLGEIPLNELDDASFHAQVGLVPQEPFLLAASVRENIDMGRGLSDERIELAARQAGAHDLVTTLEAGYDTVLGEGGARLSAGQKQLLAVARALAGQPRLLLLDEATSRVDSETEQIVTRAVAQLHGNVTVIAIAHRLSTLRHADQIAVLNHGHLAELGSHEQLMRVEQGLYKRLYQLQQLSTQSQ
ncbi:MAG: ABC transporter ATP-binding protein [Burkholderiaceae bacterium]